MSKFSSFKESQLLFENWRSFAGVQDVPIQEQELSRDLSTEEKAKEMLRYIQSMKDDDHEAFNKALHALE
jgi:hypothetical protein